MPVFGSTQGPIYPLGKITVPSLGNIVLLSVNAPVTDATGTPTGGVPGTSVKGSPAPLKVNTIKISTPSNNPGNMFLIFKASGAASLGNGVIMVIQPGQERELSSPNTANGLVMDQMALDSDNVAACSAWVTALIS